MSPLLQQKRSMTLEAIGGIQKSDLKSVNSMSQPRHLPLACSRSFTKGPANTPVDERRGFHLPALGQSDVRLFASSGSSTPTTLALPRTAASHRWLATPHSRSVGPLRSARATRPYRRYAVPARRAVFGASSVPAHTLATAPLTAPPRSRADAPDHVKEVLGLVFSNP